MSSVTFGSVGDIITVCLLAKSIVEALDDSRGSSAEYQGLITEIRSLECSLLEVELLTRSWRDSITSASLQRECSKLVAECRKTLEAFQEYLKKYDSYLSKDTRTGILRRAGTKIKWQLLAKDTVARFRSELAGHSNALNMMMVTANVMVSLNGLDKQNAAASSTERSLAAQDAALDTLRSEIQNNSALASSMTSMIRTMSQQFSWFTKLVVSVKSMVSQGFRLNLATYRAVMSIQQSLGHSMDRTLIQDPFVLEDPLGRVAPVHLQFITSWKAFYAVLATRFEGLPGHNKIERREFVIQERATNREISGNEPWEIAFRPGGSVLMSLVFQRDARTAESQSHCPYCGNISESGTADDVHCMKCGMIYRRVTEVTEIDQPTIPGLPNYWSQRPSFGRSGFNNMPPIMGPFLKRKRSMESWEELSLSEEVRSFKRVRILSNVKKTRRAAFSSWEDKMSWDVTESKRIETVASDDRFGPKSAPAFETHADIRNQLTDSIVYSGASFFPRDEDEQSGEIAAPHILDSEDDDGSGSDDSSDSVEDFDDSRKDAYDYGPLAKAQANTWVREKVIHDRYSLLEQAQVNVRDEGRPGYWISTENVFLRDRYAHRLNAKRALLLQFLPGGPILAPISEPLCRVLDIGPSNAWPVMAIRHMPKAHIQNVQTWDNRTSRDLLYQLETYGAGNYDLIHMQDWTVAANFLPVLPRELYRFLRPGGWIEIEVLELRMQHNSCVQLQVCPAMIRQGFSSIGIKGFSTAEGITESLEEASFINVHSTVERIPIFCPSVNSDGEALGNHFRDLLLMMLELVEKLANAFTEPQRSSRLAMIGEIRAALSDGENRGLAFMELVRITAQKPSGQPDSS